MNVSQKRKDAAKARLRQIDEQKRKVSIVGGYVDVALSAIYAKITKDRPLDRKYVESEVISPLRKISESADAEIAKLENEYKKQYPIAWGKDA